MADTNREHQYYVDIVSGLAERTIKRLWIALILTIVLLVGSNIAWIVYESSFEVIERTEITQENDGGYNNYVGNDGDIYNGETDH